MAITQHDAHGDAADDRQHRNEDNHGTKNRRRYPETRPIVPTDVEGLASRPTVRQHWLGGVIKIPGDYTVEQRQVPAKRRGGEAHHRRLGPLGDECYQGVHRFRQLKQEVHLMRRPTWWKGNEGGGKYFEGGRSWIPRNQVLRQDTPWSNCMRTKKLLERSCAPLLIDSKSDGQGTRLRFYYSRVFHVVNRLLRSMNLTTSPQASQNSQPRFCSRCSCALCPWLSFRDLTSEVLIVPYAERHVRTSSCRGSDGYTRCVLLALKGWRELDHYCCMFSRWRERSLTGRCRASSRTPRPRHTPERYAFLRCSSAP